MIPGKCSDGFETNVPHRTGIRVSFVICICLFMYAIDLFALRFAPQAAGFYTANFAVPFDLMVCVPLVFYFLFVRQRKVTPIAVLPAIYLGGVVSAIVSVPNSPSALPFLLGAALVVDVVVLAREVPRLVKAFREGYREGRRHGTYPIEWFTAAFDAVIPNRFAAHAAAAETAMWYYLLFSWRRKPSPPHDVDAFSYHKNSGFLALIGVILVVGALETIVVHLLVSRFSSVAAVLLTALSLYCLAWIASCARAVTTSPILIRKGQLIAAWGFFQCERVPLSSIERLALSDPGLDKREVLDMATMGGKPCWVILKAPMSASGMFGRKHQVRAVKLSPDRMHEFVECVDNAAVKR